MSDSTRRKADAPLKKLRDGIASDLLAHRWLTMARTVGKAAFELTAEEFAAIRQTYDAMRRTGTTFDPMLVALIECLTHQVTRGDDGIDGNGDEHDELFDDRLDWTAARRLTLTESGVEYDAR